ncbi:putative metal-dependent hydrolase [Fibrisoma montanum]|uniref:Putative metal-dependent hydrolase n=1 Tax=Fibrisoma montanum TaxID=2305895 RepID=A0A418MAY2_9BACT|nr:putative metal-dependent hydrolase [Fibrisoma montanum]RIV23535.1 putative metal-dependent hydrolase [Fibrisoma montanum]
MQDIDVLRYPIGRYQPDQAISIEQTKQLIGAIRDFPVSLTELVGKWGDDRLDTPYRPDGWTVRQLVHHIADSHINAYVRTKLALTETNPTISPYEEQEWAKLPDSTLDIALSLVILRNLHERWATILDALTETDLQRTYYHPGAQRQYTLSDVIGMYVWHGEHHYQHIYRLAERNGWV